MNNSIDDKPILGDVALPPELQTAGEPDIKYAADLWDALTHCVEPKGNEQVEQFFKEQVSMQASTKSNNEGAPVALPTFEAHTIDKYEFDAMQGLYHLSGLDKAGMPIKHPSWKPEWILSLKEDQADQKLESIFYWQVFETEDDARTVLKSESAEHDFRIPEVKDDDLVYRFKAKYRMGKAAYDENGHYLVDNFEPAPSHFEYAEHAMLGDNLTLRWSKSETSKGARILNLKNGNKLTYGQINALGGDFFATFDPICLGTTFDEQCKRFQAAYDTLGHDTIGVKEAQEIIENRGKEVSAIGSAVTSSQSTPQVYKGLKESGTSSFGLLDKSDEQLTRITWDRQGPSYLRMAQLNFDHFGEDGRAAYNAGHLLALKTAAAGDLETGYAMNAFADHFLGDAFAAGHVRTPRRALHGDDKAVQAAVNWVISKIRQTTNSESKPDTSAGALSTAWNAIDAVAPDLCSKFMHDEDNSLGLWVRNKRGETWKAYGDKKLFEKDNEKNKLMMKECLQASVDEVYKAFDTKNVPSFDTFAAWNIAPTELGDGNHSPLFRPDGQYRAEIENPNCRNYSDPNAWLKLRAWEGYKTLAWRMSRSAYFKGL